MSKVISQTIFSAKTAERRSWQSYVTSSAIHVVVIGVLCFVTFPAVEEVAAPPQHATLIAPVIPKYQPKVVPRPVIHQKVVLKIPEKPILPPKHFTPPPVVKPPEVKPVQVAKAPEIKAPVQHAPDIKIEAPAPPKPPVKTGVFASEELAKGPKVHENVKVGGFGDPNGVHPQDNAQGKVVVAKLGGFDLPNGPGQGGGGGHAQNGGVRATSFGSYGDPNGVPGGTGVHGSVRTGGFGDTTAAKPTQIAQVQARPSTTPVEILYKPKPVYTTEAKQMRLEGQVVLEVVFTANGSVRVIRIVHGLGHGLDEAAQQAAAQVRFKPATRGGVPVDTNATINITFQLT